MAKSRKEGDQRLYVNKRLGALGPPSYLPHHHHRHHTAPRHGTHGTHCQSDFSPPATPVPHLFPLLKLLTDDRLVFTVSLVSSSPGEDSRGWPGGDPVSEPDSGWQCRGFAGWLFLQQVFASSSCDGKEWPDVRRHSRAGTIWTKWWPSDFVWGETGEEGWAAFAGQCPFLTFGAPFKQPLLKILQNAHIWRNKHFYSFDSFHFWEDLFGIALLSLCI